MSTFDFMLRNGVSIKSVNRGEGNVTVNRGAFHDFTIPEVDPSKSITNHKVGAFFGNRASEPVTEATLSVNSSNTVRLQSVARFDAFNFAYSFEVVEFEGDVSVIRGVDSVMPAANGGVIDLPIQSLDVDKQSVLYYRVIEQGRTRYANVRYTARIINASAIQVTNRSSFFDECTIQWEILSI
jgi:hypothetical protein